MMTALQLFLNHFRKALYGLMFLSLSLLAGCEGVVWEKAFRSVNATDMVAVAAVPAPDGGVYAVGNAIKFNDEDNTDIVVVKYDAAGEPQWSEVLDLEQKDIAKAALLDRDNRLMITGSTGTKKQYDQLVASLSDTGERLWQQRYEENRAQGYAITQGESGRVYISGVYQPGTVDHYLLTVWDRDGNFLWRHDHSQMRRDMTQVVTAMTDEGERVYASKPDSMSFRRRVVSWLGESPDSYLEIDTDAQLYDVFYDAERQLVIAGGEWNGQPYLIAADRYLNAVWSFSVTAYDGAVKQIAKASDGTYMIGANIDGIEATDIYSFQLSGDGSTILWDALYSGSSSGLTETEDNLIQLSVNASDQVLISVNTNNDPRGLIGNLLLQEQYENTLVVYTPGSSEAPVVTKVNGKHIADARMNATDTIYTVGRWAVQPDDELRALITTRFQ